MDSPERDPATEGALVMAREAQVNLAQDTRSRREDDLQRREIAVREREDDLRISDESQQFLEQAQTELAARNYDMRQANSSLVIASLSASASRELAETAQQRQVEFVAMLAHELRNPLAPIRGAVALLARIDSQDPLLPMIRDVIERQVSQMARLLDDLLDVSRVTSGKVTLQLEPIPISVFIDQAVETCRALIDLQKQQLTLDMPITPLYVNGDSARLAQVIGNLLHNSAKYTPEGGAIALSARRLGDKVVIKVTDSGIGIPSATLPHVFDLFAQDVRSLSRSQGGLGIGLTVVRGMVELHGGSVEARSDGLGRGSEFSVILPCLDYVATPQLDEETAPAPSAGPARILVVDDNVDAGVVLAMLLRMSGHEVTIALDGPTALQLFAQSKPDVVLCDIGLPGMDGYELAGRLRDQHAVPRPLLIALTGYGAKEDRDRALAAGFDQHLVKPVDHEALLRLIDSELLAAASALAGLRRREGDMPGAPASPA